MSITYFAYIPFTPSANTRALLPRGLRRLDVQRLVDKAGREEEGLARPVYVYFNIYIYIYIYICVCVFTRICVFMCVFLCVCI